MYLCVCVCVEVWWNHSGMYCVVHMVRSLEHIVDTVKAILSLSDLVCCFFFSCFALHYWCVQVFSVRMDCKPLFEHFLSLFLHFLLRSTTTQFNIEIILHNQERMLCSSEHFYSMANLPNVSANVSAHINVEVSEVEDLMRKKDKFPNHIHRSSNACVKQHFSSCRWSSANANAKNFGLLGVSFMWSWVACDTTPFLMICDLLRDPLCIVCTVVINLIWSNLNT